MDSSLSVRSSILPVGFPCSILEEIIDSGIIGWLSALFGSVYSRELNTVPSAFSFSISQFPIPE